MLKIECLKSNNFSDFSNVTGNCGCCSPCQLLVFSSNITDGNIILLHARFLFANIKEYKANGSNK